MDSYSDMPHADSPDQQKNASLLAEIDELERKIAAEEQDQGRIQAEIEAAIRRMSEPISQRIMILYYLEKKTWQEAADTINYSPAQTYRFRDAGYMELERDILRERENDGRWTTMETEEGGQV